MGVAIFLTGVGFGTASDFSHDGADREPYFSPSLQDLRRTICSLLEDEFNSGVAIAHVQCGEEGKQKRTAAIFKRRGAWGGRAGFARDAGKGPERRILSGNGCRQPDR